MRFTVRARIDGRLQEVTWLDGVLLDENRLRVLVEQRLDDPRDVAATPTGPFYGPQLEDPLVALLIILEAIWDANGSDVELDGELPEVPESDEHRDPEIVY